MELAFKTGESASGSLPRFSHGDRAVLDAAYRKFARTIERRVRTLALRRGARDLAQPSLVADLTQEVFLRALSAVARRDYDTQRPLGPYLIGIATNCVIDAIRDRRRLVPTDPGRLAGDLEEGVADEPDLDHRTALALATYVAGLPPGLRSVYERRFVFGESQERSSLALGMSRRSVRTAERHLRRGLRVALRRAGIRAGELAPDGPEAG